jgi:hypothetical protein
VGDGWEAFLYSTLFGTTFAVDLDFASENGPPYITPGLYVLPPDDIYNPSGRDTPYWRDIDIFGRDEPSTCVVSHWLEWEDGEEEWYALNDDLVVDAIKERAKAGSVEYNDNQPSTSAGPSIEEC